MHTWEDAIVVPSRECLSVSVWCSLARVRRCGASPLVVRTVARNGERTEGARACARARARLRAPRSTARCTGHGPLDCTEHRARGTGTGAARARRAPRRPFVPAEAIRIGRMLRWSPVSRRDEIVLYSNGRRHLQPGERAPGRGDAHRDCCCSPGGTPREACIAEPLPLRSSAGGKRSGRGRGRAGLLADGRGRASGCPHTRAAPLGRSSGAGGGGAGAPAAPLAAGGAPCPIARLCARCARGCARPGGAARRSATRRGPGGTQNECNAIRRRRPDLRAGEGGGARDGVGEGRR